jgi:hypothetical protein
VPARDRPTLRRIAALLNAAAFAALAFAGLAALLAFRRLPSDHATAGAFAGELFFGAYVFTLAVAATTLAAGSRSGRERWLARASFALALLEAAVLTPLIAAHGAGLPIPFALLHGAAGVAHLVSLVIVALLALALSAN